MRDREFVGVGEASEEREVRGDAIADIIASWSVLAFEGNRAWDAGAVDSGAYLGKYVAPRC